MFIFRGSSMLKLLVLFTLMMNISSTYGLEIDEKLTLRFLKVSNSKKTILINRGSEDGVAVGDHAKFFITSGVIARGVVEKVSPSRSIWSLYRVVDPAEITDGKVLNLKIATPVKITGDPSKSMKEEEVPAGTDSMSMEEGAPAEINADEQKELEGMGLEDLEKPIKKEKSSTPAKTTRATETVIEQEIPSFGINTSKNWEIWGTVYVNSLSGTVDNPQATENTSTASTNSTIDFSAGIERYFLNSDSFLKNLSLTIFMHKRTIESGDSAKISTDWFEYGGGLSYHFYNSAGAINRLIGFGGLSFGAGNATITLTDPEADPTETSVEGSNTFFSGGLGAKYVFSNGFGFRGMLDYYSSSESYSFGDFTTKRTLAGPRILLGLSYRF